MLTVVFHSFSPAFEEIEKILGGKEYQSVWQSMSWLFNLTKNIYLPQFQIVVGLYMLELVVMLSYFLGELRYGDDEVNKVKSISISVLIAVIIYSLLSIILYYTMRVIVALYPVML